MRIDTIEQYNKYPDGTIFDIFLTGDDWDDDYGAAFKVVKLGDKLYEVKDSYYCFSEKNEGKSYGMDYSFELAINNSKFES